MALRINLSEIKVSSTIFRRIIRHVLYQIITSFTVDLFFLSDHSSVESIRQAKTQGPKLLLRLAYWHSHMARCIMVVG